MAGFEETMEHLVGRLVRWALMASIWYGWWRASHARLSPGVDLSLIVGGVLLVFPFVWAARMSLGSKPAPGRVTWTTTVVHAALGFLFGIPLVRALTTSRDWPGAVVAVPTPVGLALVILTGTAFLLVVANLALKGLGAPFFIALSRRLAVDWLYARTRNPMVLAGLALLLSVGVWFQSALFVLWAFFLFAPALLAFVKVYEERELELRFGAAYLEYKHRTPMLFPRARIGRRGTASSGAERCAKSGSDVS